MLTEQDLKASSVHTFEQFSLIQMEVDFSAQATTVDVNTAVLGGADLHFVLDETATSMSYKLLVAKEFDITKKRAKAANSPAKVDVDADHVHSAFPGLYVPVSTVGNVAGDAIATMHIFHEKKKHVLAMVDCIKWAQGTADSGRLQPEVKAALLSCMESIPVFSELQVQSELCVMHDVLQFRRQQWLNDVCIKMVLSSIKESYSETMSYIDPTIFGNFDLKNITREHELKRLLNQPSEYIFLPINVGGAHWALIVIDWREKVLVKMDPMRDATVFDELARVSKYIGKVLDRFSQLRHIEDKGWEQRDYCNCGVIILYYVECYLTTKAPEDLNGPWLQQQRLRFLMPIINHSRKEAGSRVALV